MKNKNGISFIIIGYNEGWKITKCLSSINKTITENDLSDWEVIYVDSNSSDDTLDRVKKFSNVNTFLITGKKNAAIARNIGAKEATKEVLFFIDGDMEIISENFPKFYCPINGLIKDFISGDFKNYYYSQNGEFLESENYWNLNESVYQDTTGGLFMITKELWEKVNGMRTVFKISQDLDLGIRLSNIGYRLYRKKDLLAKHHTISYYSKERLWKDIFKGKFLYRKPLLYRKNISNPVIIKYLLREVSLVILILCSFLAFTMDSSLILIGYPLLLIVKILIKRRTLKKDYLSNYVRYIIFDIGTLLGFFFFWPTTKSDLVYKRV